MTLRDELLPVIEEAYALVAELGLRTIRVWVVSQGSTQPFNTVDDSGNSGLLSDIEHEIIPRPRVVQTPERPGWSGGATGALYDGRSARRGFTIGPIARSYSIGGKKVSDLFRIEASASTRPLIALADESEAVGGELGASKIAFKVERVLVKQFGIVLEVVEADEVT